MSDIFGRKSTNIGENLCFPKLFGIVPIAFWQVLELGKRDSGRISVFLKLPDKTRNPKLPLETQTKYIVYMSHMGVRIIEYVYGKHIWNTCMEDIY